TAILPAKEIIGEFNATGLKPGDPRHRLAVLSEKMDFAHPDSADPFLLKEILWKSVKGVNSKMPGPVFNRLRILDLGKKTGRTATPQAKKPAARRDDDD